MAPSGAGLNSTTTQNSPPPTIHLCPEQDNDATSPASPTPQLQPQSTATPAHIYQATNYTAAASPTKKNSSRIRSETGQALLVPALLCGVLGPLCWVLGRLRWSFPCALWSSIVIVYAVSGLRERLRRLAKLDAARTAFRKRVLQEDETAEWLNIILFRVWQFHEPLLSSKLRQAFFEKLEAVRPSGVLAFEIPLFTLGKKSPYMSSARIITRHPLFDSKVPEDRIVMHMNMGFQAPDLKIVILAKTSYGTIPIKIKDFYLQGRMRCEMDLVPRYPHISTASFTFLETPICEFDILPMGVSVMEVPYLAAILQSQIVYGINEHILHPAKVTFNLIETQSEATSVACADGIMFVTVLEARLPPHGAAGGSSSKNAQNVVALNGSEYYMKLQLGEEFMVTREVQEDDGAGDKRLDRWLGGGDIRSPTRANRLSGHAPNIATTGHLTPHLPNRLSRALTAHLNLLSQEPRQPRLLFGDETFAFLVGGNVGAVDTVKLTLKQRRTKTSRTVCSLAVPLEEALDPDAPKEGSRIQVPLLDGQGEGGGQVTLALRYVSLPEVVLEQTQATVIHRVNEHTLSPVDVDAESPGLLKATDHPYAGSLVLIVHKAEELPSTDVHGVRDSYAVVFAGEREVFRTKTVPTKTLAPEWEQSKEFSTFDVRQVKLTLAIYDADRGYGEKEALAAVELDVHELFTAEGHVHSGRRVKHINKHYFRLQKPGAGGSVNMGSARGGYGAGGGGRDLAVPDRGKSRKGGDMEGNRGKSGKSKSYGFLCVSVLFRPLPAIAMAPDFTFRSTIGNKEDDAAGIGESLQKISETGGAGGKRSPRDGSRNLKWAKSSSSSGKPRTAAAPQRMLTGVVEDETEEEENNTPKKSSNKFFRFFRDRHKGRTSPS
ncbi:hypothetical protein VYU27_006115 [Nannochloropsis oceanica]